MRVLIVGEGRYSVYEAALAAQLVALNHEAEVLGWAGTFASPTSAPQELPRHHSVAHRLGERLAIGPHHSRFNADVVKRVQTYRPDTIVLYNAKQVRPSTVRELRSKRPSALVVQYCNDNPFSPGASWSRWRHVRASVPLVDLALAYRSANLDDLRTHGAPRVALWRSACTLEDLETGSQPLPKDIDVLFAGHFEEDGRAEMLEGLLKAGINVRVHGGGWQSWAESTRARGSLLAEQSLTPLFGNDYRETLARAKVALCFLSTLNQDTYTRRSFEIPAVGTAQLSQYSDDLASLFNEGSEIVFFRSPVDLLDKTQELLADEAWRDSVAQGGRSRVIADGHDIRSRAAQLVREIEKARNGRGSE